MFRTGFDRKGTVLGQLAGSFKSPIGMRCTFASVLAIATWNREGSEPEYRVPPLLRCMGRWSYLSWYSSRICNGS